MEYDLAVIGAGPGGYTAAIRAEQLGMKVVVIDEREQPGGTCLNVGCIPSKALLESSQTYYGLKTEGKKIGVDGSAVTFQFPQMMVHKNQVVKELTDGVKGLLKAHKIDYVVGKAVLKSPQTIQVGKFEIRAAKILLATGSEPIALPFLPFDEERVLSSTGALALREVPKRLLVIGAGVIGLELASVYARLGSKVDLVEMLDHIGGTLDQTIHTHYLKALKAQGLNFHLSTQVKSAQVGKTIALELQGAETGRLEGDAVLVSVGRRPFMKGLGVDELGIQKTARGFIQVDSRYCTSIPSIFAIGDLTEGPMLAHRASEEGVACVEGFKEPTKPVDEMLIPGIIYTHPEVATCGFTEEEAIAAGRKVIVGTCSLKSNGRAKAAGDTEGMAKIVGDEATGKLLGMHLMMPHASELISCGVMALKARATVKELGEMPFGHPTISETIKEACLKALKRPINIL